MVLDRQINVPIPVGIVGSGGIAQIIHLPILQEHPEIEIKAICDVDASKAAVVADRFGVENVYQDLAEMLEKEDLEIVFILTPNNLHLPMSLLVLEYGINLFIEKPAAMNSLQAKKIKEKAEEIKRHVMVGMQNRFRPDVRAFKRFLMDKEIGRVFHVRISWLQAKYKAIKQPWIFHKGVSGGGVVLDLGVQLIDLASWLFSNPQVNSVNAHTFSVDRKIDVEDYCVAHVAFAEDLVMSLEVSWVSPITKDHMQLKVIGENGTITLNPLRLQKLWHGHLVDITPQLKDDKITHFKKGYQEEINHYVSFLTGRAAYLESSIDDAIGVLKIVDNIYESVEKQQQIKQ